MSSEEDPCPRAFHFASTVADELTFVCGGLTSGGDEKTLHAFSQLEEVWKSRTTTGVSLPKLYEGGCTLSGNSIYLFGGLDGDQAYGELYSLDTEEMEWKKVSTGPMQCSGCGFVHYRNKLITFGGCGPQPATTQPGATYQEIAGGQGQNNQLQIFDLEEGSWSSPEVTGTRPPPCSNFTFVPIDDKRVLLFGGDQGRELGVTNDAYIFDVEVLHWTKLDYPKDEPCPAARKYHAAVCLGQGTQPQLVVFGGEDEDGDTLTDIWILDVESRRWKEIKHPQLRGRYGHSATAISLTEGLTEVTLFGGVDENYDNISDTTVFRFEQNKTTGVWELVDVADRSQLGTPDRLKTKEKRIAHKAFLSNIEKHMKESGSTLRRMANVVFVGLPGSGKSLLIANLLKIEDLMRAPLSTNVMNGIITVDISADTSRLHVANVEDECSWSEVEYPVHYLRQIAGFLPTQESLTATPVADQHPTGPGQDHQDPSGPAHSPGSSQALSRSKPTPVLRARKSSPKKKWQPSEEQSATQSLERPKVMNPLEIVNKLLNENTAEENLRFLENKTSLYCSDTGGHIIFQELLALLVSPGSIFVFVFSLVNGLGKKMQISFRKAVKKGIEHTNVYTSSLTVGESFLQTMSSIDSMETLADDSSSSQQKPYVFVVGTRRDVLEKELGQEGAEARIAELNEELISLVREHKYEDLVVMADQGKGQLMFAADNTRRGDRAFGLLRSRVKHFVESRDEFNIKFPLSFLLASLELQQSKEPFVDRERFTQTVSKYGIRREDMDHLIYFMQSIGVIRYFPIPGLNRVLMKDPKILYNFVSHLLIQSFLTEVDLVSEISEIQKGIYSMEYLERCISKFEPGWDLVTLEMVILLLKELRIMAPFYDQESESDKLFVPCAINRLFVAPAVAEKSVVQTLAIKFKCGHCPMGMFGALVHYLLTHHKSDKTMEWVLDKSLIFRDKVSFKVGRYRDVVALKSSSTHLEVSCHPTCQLKREEMSVVQVVCHKVRSAVLSGVAQATITLHYDMEKTRHSLALVCSNEECAELHDIKGNCKYFNCSGKLYSLPDAAACWFANVPVYSFPEGAELSATEGNEFEVQFSVTQDPPLLKGKKNTLWKDDVAVSDDRVSIGESVIHFSSIQRADAGRYTITSSNFIGQGSGSFCLTVFVHPKYELKNGCVQAQAGKSPTLHFCVTSEPPLTENTTHVITGKMGGIIRRFKVQENCITFRKVKITDTGLYTISCRNAKGLVGTATLKLHILESANPSASMPAADNSQPSDTAARSHPINLQQLHFIKWQSQDGVVHRYRLVDYVSAKWRKFGHRIGLKSNQMENWASETRSNEVCWDRVINAWLDGKGQDLYSQTWEGFYEMLKDVELGGHVPALKEAVASLGT